jgi:hypothetical protein
VVGWQLIGFVLVIEGASGWEFDSCEVQQLFWAGKFVSLHTNPTLACSTLKQCQRPFYGTQCSLFACYAKTTIGKKESKLLSSLKFPRYDHPNMAWHKISSSSKPCDLCMFKS